MLESNSIDKIDMSDFDIEISSDEDEDFITNSNIAGNMEGNPVLYSRKYTARYDRRRR